MLTAAALALVSCGSAPEGPEGLSVTVTAPPSGGAQADSSYTVQWQSEGASGSATVLLYYDTDTSPSSGRILIASGQPATGQRAWDCSTVPDGAYYIQAVLSDGSQSASDYGDGPLIVNHGNPAIVVTAPPAGGAEADTTYDIEWLTLGFGDPTIDLFYDTDTDPSSGLVEIVLDLDDDGSYSWDCQTVPEGYYYIHAVADEPTQRETAADYSDGMLAIDHGGLDPEITITEPPSGGASADNFFAVEWLSLAPPDATVDLYYDTDTEPGSGLTAIQSGLPDDGYYMWDCSGVPAGTYYIYGVIETRGGRMMTGLRGTGSDYSDGTLTVLHDNPWELTVTAPPAGGATADESYTVTWETDAPGSETVDIFYSADTTGSELFTAQLDIPNTGSYEWNLAPVEEGDWFVYAVVGEDRGPGGDWSDGPLTVLHEDEYTMLFTAPPPSGATADDQYTLQWTTDAPSTAQVALFYSESQSGGTLYQITPSAPNSGSFSWDCSEVPENEYYIFGIVFDPARGRGGKGSGQAWSQGTLTIDHSLYSMQVTAPPAGGASADSSYTVQWTAQGGSESLVDLFYDDDLNPSTKWSIASGLPNSGSYEWDTSIVADGSYYVYAVIYDPSRGYGPGTDEWAADYSDGALVVSHTYFFVTVVAPPPWGAWAEDQYTIQWAAGAPAGSTVDLFYDTDTNPSSGLVGITSNIPYSQFQYLWNCSTTPEGVYYIYALLDDGSSTTYDYSDGTLTINRDPLWLWITEPNPGGASADDMFTIEWMSEGPAGRTIDLYYDTDTNPASGLAGIIAGLVTSGATDSYDWNCSAVPEGSYYIYGVLLDPVTRADSATHYSEGMLTISH
jgi:hypothetical protein